MSWLAAATLAGAGLSYLGGRSANAAQSAQALRQMQFQERMSNTSHQREVEDLRKAGLNPILSSKYGGASTPPGAQAQIKDVVTPAVSTALATKRLGADIAKLKAETSRTQQDERNLKLQEGEIQARTRDYLSSSALRNMQYNVELHKQYSERERPGLLRAQTDQSTASAAQLRKQTEILRENLKGAVVEGKISESTFGIVTRMLDKILPAASTAKGLFPRRR